MGKYNNSNNNSNNNPNKEYLKVDSFQIIRKRFLESGQVIFDIKLNGISIYGCRHAETKDGKDFISFPSRKGSDGNYYNIVHCRLSEEDTDKILSEVFENV